MRPPKNNRFPAQTTLLAAAGLGLGALLGWNLRPASPAAHETSPGSTALEKNGHKSGAEQAKTPQTPYDPAPVLAGGFAQLAEFEVWLRTASCDDVCRVMFQMESRYPWGVDGMAGLLTGRFREFSPRERFAALEKAGAGKSVMLSHACQKIFGDLAADSLPGQQGEFLKLFRTFPDMDVWWVAPGLKAWAVADLGAVFQFLEKTRESFRNQALEQVVRDAAESNLARTQELVLSLPNPQARDKAMRGLALTMGKTDLGAALDWLNANQFGKGLGSGQTFMEVRGVITVSARANPAAAAQLLLDRPGLFEGGNIRNQVEPIFREWAQKDAKAAAAWVTSHPLPEAYQKVADSVLLENRMRQQPLPEALADLGNLPGDLCRGAAKTLVQRLSQEDPGRVVDRLLAAVPESGRAEAMAAAAESLPSWQFAQLTPFLSELGKIMEEQPRLISRFAELPGDQMLSILQQLPPKTADAVRGEVMERSLDNDPGLALRLAEDLPSEKLSPYNASRLATTMAEEDPAKASSWVAGFPEGENKEWAALNLVNHWAKYDPAAATDWVQSLPPGGTRDRAALEAVKIQGRTGNSQAALTLAASLPDPKARTEATGYALQALWHHNPAAAEAALISSGLTSGDQTALAEKLAQGGFSR